MPQNEAKTLFLENSMFRFYSYLSPNGAPDAAALLASREASHTWTKEGRLWILRVFGLHSIDNLFCVAKDTLFIHQIGEILRVSLCPDPAAKSFGFEALTLSGLSHGFRSLGQLQSLTPPQWVTASSKIVNTIDLDRSHFPVLDGGLTELPLRSVGGISENGASQSTIRINLPSRLLGFLRKEEGPISFEIQRTEGSTTLSLSIVTQKRRFFSNVFLPDDAFVANAKFPLLVGDGVEVVRL